MNERLAGILASARAYRDLNEGQGPARSDITRWMVARTNLLSEQLGEAVDEILAELANDERGETSR